MAGQEGEAGVVVVGGAEPTQSAGLLATLAQVTVCVPLTPQVFEGVHELVDTKVQVGHAGVAAHDFGGGAVPTQVLPVFFV